MTRAQAVQEAQRCPGRVTRSDGTWRPCDRPEGHGIDSSGFGCMTSFKGETEPRWNPRDTERRKGERRDATRREGR